MVYYMQAYCKTRLYYEIRAQLYQNWGWQIITVFLNFAVRMSNIRLKHVSYNFVMNNKNLNSLIVYAVLIVVTVVVILIMFYNRTGI
jgi:hypothetical protein